MSKVKLSKSNGIERYLEYPVVAVDLETTGLSWRKEKILGISLSNGEASSYFWWKDLSDGDKGIIDLLLKSSDILKVFHNAKFDIHFLMSAGFKHFNNIEDTYVMSFLSNENGSHKLKDLAQRHIDPNAKDSKEALMEALDGKSKVFDLTKVDPKLVEEYARMDAYYTFRLHQYYRDEISTKFKAVFETEKELLFSIIAMEREGVSINVDHLRAQSKSMGDDAAQLGAEIYSELGVTEDVLNLSSNDQVATFLIDKYGVKLPLTDKGKPKVDKYTLEKVNLPVASKIQTFRQLTHLSSTYCTGLIDKAEEGKIYCEFLQNGAVTGRFSSINPNLQQIPRELGDIRSAFVTPKNFHLFFFDYDQMEMRLFAHYSNDPGLLDAFAKNQDVHSAVAAKLYKVEIDKVEDQHRRNGKTMNFGIIYGMGVKSFALKLNTSEDQAKQFREWYFQLFPKVRAFMFEVSSRIKNRGFVFNVFGRYRRHIPDEAYKGVNSLIQGCAADVVKVAMVRVSKLLKNRKSKMLVQVHDELFLKIHHSEQDLIPLIKAAMEDFTQFRVPLKVDIKWSSKSWGQKEKWNG